MLDKKLIWVYNRLLICKYKIMHRQHHKMHKEEIIFHLIVPVVIFATVAAMGYYVVMLVTDIMKMA